MDASGLNSDVEHCRIVADIGAADLPRVADFFSTLSGLYTRIARLEVLEEEIVRKGPEHFAVEFRKYEHLDQWFMGGRIPELAEPKVLNLSMASPLHMELFSEAGLPAFFIWILRNPEAIGAWIPKVRTGWHRGQYELDVVKRERATLAQMAPNLTVATDAPDKGTGS